MAGNKGPKRGRIKTENTGNPFSRVRSIGKQLFERMWNVSLLGHVNRLVLLKFGWRVLGHPLGHDLRDVRTNTAFDPRTRSIHRSIRQVRGASGSLNLRVTEELADHREALASQRT